MATTLEALENRVRALEIRLKTPRTDHRIPLLATEFDVEKALFPNRAYDSFNRANNTLLGACDSGQTWTEDEGDLEIDTNVLRATAVDGTPEGIASIELGNQEWLNLWFRLGVLTNAVLWGMTFRMVDSDNYLSVELYTGASPNQIRLYKCVAGVRTALQTSNLNSDYGNGDTGTFHVVASGPVIYGWCHNSGNPATDTGGIAYSTISDTWTTALKGGTRLGFKAQVNDVEQLLSFRAEAG